MINCLSPAVSTDHGDATTSTSSGAGGVVDRRDDERNDDDEHSSGDPHQHRPYAPRSNSHPSCDIGPPRCNGPSNLPLQNEGGNRHADTEAGQQCPTAEDESDEDNDAR